MKDSIKQVFIELKIPDVFQELVIRIVEEQIQFVVQLGSWSEQQTHEYSKALASVICAQLRILCEIAKDPKSVAEKLKGGPPNGK